MTPKYIIVQAGGKGTRLGHLTVNKPKALVAVGNLPMLFHLFQRFPESKYIIIADYKADVMRRYLSVFSKVKYLIVNADGYQGTSAGIRNALSKIPGKEPFMLIWSDLVLPKDFSFPEDTGDYIGLSNGFTCRWRYRNDRFEEIPSDRIGVAGMFLFADKASLEQVPLEGEFVRWLQAGQRIFQPLPLTHTQEFGVLSVLEEENARQCAFQCRPFNRIEEDSQGRIVKRGIDQQGLDLAAREIIWYRFVKERGFSHIPQIYSYEPLIMEHIKGENIFQYHFNVEQKKRILAKIVACLQELHSLGMAQADYFSIYDAYIKKTWKRIDCLRDLIPFADQQEILINGRKCRNIFFCKAEIETIFAKYTCDNFVFLHGDNTFSNMLLDQNGDPVLIDPRGYFGHTQLYGDPMYDWAKLYYSIVGNYDQFNRKRFSLVIGDQNVRLQIESNGWEDMEEEFFRLLGEEVERRYVRLIHAIIWLSLSTYAWEDYDSICGAFYNGLFYLEGVMGEEE